ncbi:MAG: hypothetical protein HY077_04410 [Elusimicrobia bacterium]|nr:hypothetical protein [Elusimicrobiota bacterium]
MRYILAALLASIPAGLHAEALVELTGLAREFPDAAVPVKGRPVKSGPSNRACPGDWERRKSGDCWIKTAVFDGEGEVRAYVHPAGWLVDPRCLRDKRFGARDLLDALTLAVRKMDPAVPASAGGCLGTFNPEWGRELKGQVWSRRMVVQCSADYDTEARTCANHSERDAWVTDENGRGVLEKSFFHMIALRNVSPCMVKGSSGLAGVFFHEALHAAGADNEALESHNQGWDRAQYRFIYDRVYGAEATCFFGPKANVVQCRQTVQYGSSAPRYELCSDFDRHFTDLPPGFLKD